MSQHMQDQPESPPPPVVPPVADDQYSLKSQVDRIQDLSLKSCASRADGFPLQETFDEEGDAFVPEPPPPASEHHPHRSHIGEEAFAVVRPASQTESSPLKRKNKRASLSPTAKKKTSLSDIVVVEGELVVAEELEQKSDRDAVQRTLGSIYCVLVVKNNSSLHLETVSEHRHHLIDLEIGKMTFVPQEHLDDAYTFKLQYRYHDQGKPSSYSFAAATSEQYEQWVTSIAGFQEQNRFVPKVTPAETSSSSSLRRMRSIASLCDQPPVGSFLYARPPKTKHLILVRHGHYINAHARHVSDTDQVLSQMGRQQAEFTGKYLEQLYSRSPTRHDITILHSDMTRAVETATTIGKDFGHCTLSSTRLLREGWPGRPYSSHQAIPQVPEKTNPELDRIDGERMELAFQTIFTQSAEEEDDDEEYSYQVIVCHANLIRFFLCRAMGIDPVGRWGHFEINHCGVTRIDVCENRPLKIISVNETGHLPHSLITSSEDHL